jgi:hypothetical protein
LVLLARDVVQYVVGDAPDLRLHGLDGARCEALVDQASHLDMPWRVHGDDAGIAAGAVGVALGVPQARGGDALRRDEQLGVPRDE